MANILLKDSDGNYLYPKTKAKLVENLPTLSITNENELGAPTLSKDDTNAYALEATLLYDIIHSYTFSNAHTRDTALVGDIYYCDGTPIAVVVIHDSSSVKVMSLGNVSADGSLVSDGIISWSSITTETGIIDTTEGKENTYSLVELGDDYKAAIACSLFSTIGTNKGDWYLPAKDELSDMDWGKNNTIIQNAINSVGYPTLKSGSMYWSSTEGSPSNLVYILHTGVSVVDTTAKTAKGYIRAFLSI